MGKKKVNKYPTAFRKMALERLKTCRNATELVHRTDSSFYYLFGAFRGFFCLGCFGWAA